MDERFFSDLVASGFEQVRQQAEENHKRNRSLQIESQVEICEL